MAKIQYIKCPRCELNYIDSRQEICDVCKEELGQPINAPAEEEEEERELCPICKTNYMNFGEEMCEQCAMERNEGTSEDDGWREYLDDEPEVMDEDEALPLEELQEDEFNESFDDEEDFSEDDGFDDFDDEDDETFEEDGEYDDDFDDVDDEDDDE